MHRDFKPDNFLISDQPDGLKAADFGLSALLAAGDTLSGDVGTPGYQAPEVLQGQVHTFAADLWSLGVTLYTMLSGLMPFNAMAGDVNPFNRFATCNSYTAADTQVLCNP